MSDSMGTPSQGLPSQGQPPSSIRGIRTTGPTPAVPQQYQQNTSRIHAPHEPQAVAMDWQRFDWPAMAGEPDQDWFDYLEQRGWTVSPVPTMARIGARSYLRYLGWRARSA